MKRNHTILLVEDDGAVRKFVSKILKDNGYRVLEAGNGRDALDLCSRHSGRIHAMLADIILSGPMDGLELGAEMRRLRPDMRALYMSGYPGSFADRLELEAVSDFFLAKPFTPKSLLELLWACLSGEAAPEPAHGRAARAVLHG